METVTRALGWTCCALTWVWALWMVLGTIVGGVLLALDEWRLRRTKPKPEAIRANTDQLESASGGETFRLDG